MQKIKYNCGCIREIRNDGDLINCCNKHKMCDSQEELLDVLSEEFSKCCED